MIAKWHYNDDCVGFADGTGTYAMGFYAASPSTVEAGESPEEGPFQKYSSAQAAAEKLSEAETKEKS